MGPKKKKPAKKKKPSPKKKKPTPKKTGWCKNSPKLLCRIMCPMVMPKCDQGKCAMRKGTCSCGYKCTRSKPPIMDGNLKPPVADGMRKPPKKAGKKKAPKKNAK